MKVIKICNNCNKEFSFRNSPSDIKAGNGKYCSKLCSFKQLSKTMKDKKIHPTVRFVASGKDHPSWKGEFVSYSGLHKWVARQLGTPKICEHCSSDKEKKYEWANKSGNYLRNTNDWIRLCCSCHARYDNRLVKSWITRRYE